MIKWGLTALLDNPRQNLTQNLRINIPMLYGQSIPEFLKTKLMKKGGNIR